MRKFGIGLVIVALVCAACNLSPTAPTPEPSYTPRVTPDTAPTQPPTDATPFPTLLPLPGLPATGVPVTSVPLLGASCQVYTTYSGVDPNNLLSLRDVPSVSGLQVLRVPNNASVYLIPGSSEVEADQYHWLNVIYVNPSQLRYQGWIARDSFATNGVRDPSIATLIQTGAQAAC